MKEEKKRKNKKKKKAGIIPRLLFLICLGVFCFAGWKIFSLYKQYQVGVREYEDLRQYTEDKKKKPEKKDVCPKKVDFDKLKKINPDVVGWIYIPNTEIDYPIVKGKDNKQYLHRTYKGVNNFAGSIFLDCDCRADFYSANSIVYGHNMRNGSMFGLLKKYYDTNYNKKANFKKRKIIWIITPEREKEYTIFSAREINVYKDLEPYFIDFTSLEAYQEFLDQAVDKSLYKTGVPVDTSNFVLTLSTCTSTTESGRFIVHAKMIQDSARDE